MILNLTSHLSSRRFSLTDSKVKSKGGQVNELNKKEQYSYMNRSLKLDYYQKSDHEGFDLAHIHKQEGFQDL